MNNEKDIKTYINLAERMNKPKKSEKQQYWEDRANALYLLTGKQMVVIEVDKGHYQCWNKSMIGKMEYVYETKDGEPNG